MSKTKSNFVVDESFPLIDGIGHSDKQHFFNVKGGGSSNTTNFDGFPSDLHVFLAYRDFTDVLSGGYGGDYDECVLPPSFYGSGAITGEALNTIPPGDLDSRRASDRVCLRRIEISGSLSRPSGQHVASVPSTWTPPVLPKVFVALVLDMKSSGTVASPSSFSAGDVFFPGGAYDIVSGTVVSNCPVLRQLAEYRYRVLAHDVIDFDKVKSARSEYLLQYLSSTATGGPLPVPEETVNDVSEDVYYWENASAGFRFDVDLADVLCSFKSDAYDSASCLADIGLYMVAVLFDGVSPMPLRPASGDFNFVRIQYSSRLFFYDYLSPTLLHAPAGADGSVVPPAEDDLEVLADESSKLAGLPALPDSPIARVRKKIRKGDAGFYNFIARNDDALMHFPDDPEVARLATPGTRGSSKGPARKKGRRYGAHRGNVFPFGSFDPDEPGSGERDFKRGKF